MLDGWTAATSLSSTGALIWSQFDGHSSLGEIAADLATLVGVDEREVLSDLLRFVQDLSVHGLLENAPRASIEETAINLEIVLPHAVGDVIDDIALQNLDGTIRHSTGLAESGSILLINWNPHCGYCARITRGLSALTNDLDGRRCRVVLVASGGVEANRDLADKTGFAAEILLLEPGQDLFRAAGTPSAYHLDPSGQIIDTPAYGGDQVLTLARRLAGASTTSRTHPPTETTRYLLASDGACEPLSEGALLPVWAGTRVYRFGDFHVGIRHDSPETGIMLDRLFPGQQVDDPDAGHSFSVALDTRPGSDHGSTSHGLNLLVQPGQPTLRSRNPTRVLEGLLSRLSQNIVPFEPSRGRLQVHAIAVRTDDGAALLPWELHGFAPRLQGLLAQRGIALADVQYPEIDLLTSELIVPYPAVDHDAEVLKTPDHPTNRALERPRVRPGRYPLRTWCLIHPWAVEATTRFTPAAAAAGALSTVLHTGHAAERVRQLGELFEGGVDAIGIWYDSDVSAVAAAVQALDHG